MAIVGGGIAGLVCAYYLRESHAVTLYERAPRLGGHVHAVRVPGVAEPVETGVLAFHRSHYPELYELFERFEVQTAQSGVGLGIWDVPSGLVFGSERWFEHVPPNELADLVQRMNRHARSGNIPNVRLDAYLAERGYSEALARLVLWPSISALWGFQPAEIMAMSARTVADMLNRFFITAHREPFERIVPSSDAWLGRLVGALDAEIVTGCEVKAIRGAWVDGREFDQVILATHADTALALLAEPTAAQREVLGAFPYNHTTSTVHTDTRILPGDPACWTEYNYRADGERTTTTWDMGRIQGVPALVTVGPRGYQPVERALASIDFAHPASPPSAVEARPRLWELNRAGPVYFCGSYFGSTGSNECAVASAARLCRQLL